MLLRTIRNPWVQVGFQIVVLTNGVRYIATGHVIGYLLVLLSLIAFGSDIYELRKRRARKAAFEQDPTANV